MSWLIPQMWHILRTNYVIGIVLAIYISRRNVAQCRWKQKCKGRFVNIKSKSHLTATLLFGAAHTYMAI